MNLDGSAPTDNPFYDASERDHRPRLRLRLRLPQSVRRRWRAADASPLRGRERPGVDRFAQIVAGRNYGWNGTDASMRHFALYNWDPAHAPVNIAFVQPRRSAAAASRRPRGPCFVTESGPTYATGPRQRQAHRRVRPGRRRQLTGSLPDRHSSSTPARARRRPPGWRPGPTASTSPTSTRTSTTSSPIDPGANLLRVRWPEPEAGPGPAQTSSTPADGRSTAGTGRTGGGSARLPGGADGGGLPGGVQRANRAAGETAPPGPCVGHPRRRGAADPPASAQAWCTPAASRGPGQRAGARRRVVLLALRAPGRQPRKAPPARPQAEHRLLRRVPRRREAAVASRSGRPNARRLGVGGDGERRCDAADRPLHAPRAAAAAASRRRAAKALCRGAARDG